MTKHEAKAKAIYDAYIRHWIDFTFGRRNDEPRYGDYGYRHGWIVLGGRSYCVSSWYPSNQPIMD